MIFYIATDTDGKKHVLTVEAEAKKLDKSYVEIDQPNDKASLKTLIQESFDTIHQLEGQLRSKEFDTTIAPVTIPYDPEQDLLDPAKMSEATKALVAPASSRPTSYVEWSIEISKVFSTLPLAHQLDLAATALERARESEALCRQADAKPEEIDPADPSDSDQ